MHKIVLAITGASGSIYPKLLLQKLLTIPEQWSELGVVMTTNAKQVWETELGNDDYKRYLESHDRVKVYGTMDFNAPFASGSGRFDTVIIAPCSMGTLGRISTGVSTDLITRAADVVLKERRKLVLAVRESPLSEIHLENMLKLSRMGAVILPPMPAFYNNPRTIDDVIDYSVARILDQFDIQVESAMRWSGDMGVGRGSD